MTCFSSGISVKHIDHVETSHASIVMVTSYIYGTTTCFSSCSQLRESSCAATTVIPIYFQGQFWVGFSSTNFFFWVLPHQKHSSRGVFLMNYGTSIERFSFKIYSCSEYFQEIPRKTTTELIFNIVMSF